ncbi:MAG: DUF3892 domain-containing protein [Symbiobacteriia bacterium]
MSRQVTCINKRDHYNPHERITHIGGAGWRLTEDEAIRNIEARYEDYYVSKNGRRVNVVVESRNGRKYLKTEDDDYAPNNLLALPECPKS